jgi:hypothetical protein
MPVDQVTVTFRRFDYSGSTPFLNINKGSPIRYSPTPFEYYFGTVLKKDETREQYDLPSFVSKGKDHCVWSSYHRDDIEIVFHLLLHKSTTTNVSPRSDDTSSLSLELIPFPMSIYPTLNDFYRYPSTRSMSQCMLWIEGWKWWYLTWRRG